MLNIKDVLKISDAYFKDTNTAIIFKDDTRYIAFPCGKNCCQGIYINPKNGEITLMPDNDIEPFYSISIAKQIWFWLDDEKYKQKIYKKNLKKP